MAVLRNNIVYEVYLFHLVLIFLFTYPKLNIKKKIMSCGFSFLCSKSDLTSLLLLMCDTGFETNKF